MKWNGQEITEERGKRARAEEEEERLPRMAVRGGGGIRKKIKTREKCMAEKPGRGKRGNFRDGTEVGVKNPTRN